MNTKEELTGFKPRHEFFIGLDSDGTVFDSMNIKHLKAFIPAAFTVWDFGDKAGDFRKIMEHINLYSETRGINRFPGLLMAFEKLGTAAGTIPPGIDCGPLKEFAEKSGALSNSALVEWMEKNPHPFLDEVYKWSLEADRLFEEHTRGLLPFLNVEPAIKLMAEKADIVVISSASGKGLDKDFAYSGLDQYIAIMAGQELGSKKAQLSLGCSGKYAAEKVLMVGDAPGDLEAANAVEASFFPVRPGEEDESWVRLKEEALPRFFAGTYRGEYEESLLAEFRNLLK
jgi:phosphoglycolate phosphatase-like HAD superfamily hydrolase